MLMSEKIIIPLLGKQSRVGALVRARCPENNPRRALGSADPTLRSRHQLVERSCEMRNAPRERKPWRQKWEKGVTLLSSLRVPTCMQMVHLCVLQAISPGE